MTEDILRDFFWSLATDDCSSSFYSATSVHSVEFNICTNGSFKNQNRNWVTCLL